MRFSVRAVINKALGRYDFEGCYKSFSDIASPTNHDNAEFANAAVDARLRNWPGTYAIDLLPLVVADYTDVTVVDVGGGAATGLSQIASSLNGTIRLRYVLVETRAMCLAVTRIPQPIICSTVIPDKAKPPIIINAASVLQYIPCWQAWLGAFTRLKPEAIIVSNTPVSEQPTYARCQVNGRNRRIPAWCFNRTELDAEFAALGYRRGYYIEHNQSLRHKNAPAPSAQASMIYYPASSSR